MADENAGAAWYELGARDNRLRQALDKAEADIRRAGTAGEKLFATPMERATGRVAKGVDEVARSLNNLSGRTPKELADQLNRAEHEADQALAAIRKIAASDDLSPRDAQRYADALNEIQVEADQTVADLRELQRSDPKFDTAELNRAAELIDRVGDEAKGTASELDRLGKGDTNLERVAKEAKHAGDELDRADQRTHKFRGALGSLKGAIVGLGVAFGLREAIGKMNDAVDAASNLAESQGKVGVVFGNSADDIEAWSDDSATAFGASKQAALEAAGTYGNLLQAFGVARPQAADMSKTLVQLAADLASFNNTSVDEALNALRSGLSGETEPLKRYGVALNDARLKEEALRLGLIQTATGTLPIAVKAQAAYALILKDTALAQGDFARTSGGYANQQRILAAELENTMAAIGKDLLPLWKDLIGFMRDPGIPIIKGTVAVIRETAEGIGEFVDNVSDDVRWLQIHFGDLGKTVEDRANEIGADVVEMKDHVVFAMNEMGLGIDAATTYAEQRLAGVPHAMTSAVLATRDAMQQADDLLNGPAKDMADAIPDAMQDAQDAGAAIARQTPGALAGQLRAGIEDYDKAIDELAEVAANSVSDLAERQKIEGILASQALTDALTSDSTRTRLLAQELVGDLVSDYELLAPGAAAAGELVDPSLADGINNNLGLAVDAAEALADAAGNPLVDLDASAGGASLIKSWINGMDSAWATGINRVYAITTKAGRILGLSLPTEGPLAGGIASGGYSVIESWFSDMAKAAREGMGTVTGIAADAGDALNPSASWAGGLLAAVPEGASVGKALAEAVVRSLMQTIPADEVASRAISGAMQAQLQQVPPGPDPSWHSARNGGTGTVVERHVHLHTTGPVPVSTEDELARILDRTQWVSEQGGLSLNG